MSAPAYPCCLPCDPCPAPIPQGPPFCYTANELASMPQCGPPCPPPTTRCITVQQPPRLVVQKKTICVRKIINDARVMNRMEKVYCPQITQCSKVVRIPVMRYLTEVIKEPKITWFQSYVPDPYVICIPRIVIQPKEVCQTLLCQPKPQVVDVPVPPEYCVYQAGPQRTRCSPPCPPSPCPPSSGFPVCAPTGPRNPPCGPCWPCGPGGPCQPCRPFGPPAGPCLPCGPFSPSCGPCAPCGPCC